MKTLILLFLFFSFSFAQKGQKKYEKLPPEGLPEYEIAVDTSVEYEIAIDTRTDIDKLSDTNREIRKNALISIGTKREKKAIKHIVKILKDKDIEIRTIAVNILGEMGHSEIAGEKILEVFKTDKDNANFQMACIIALGKIKYKPAIPYLRERLNHLHPLVRTYTVSALSEFNDPTVYPLIKEKILDPAEGVSIEAIRASVRCKIKTAIPLIKEKLKHPVSGVRREAVLALGELGDRTVISDLEGLLEDKDASIVDAVKKSIEKIEAREKK